MSSTTRTTTLRMTKFERTQLVGMRMEQIARGAPPAVDVDEGSSVRDIVLKEIRENKIPLLISRTLPNGRVETFRVDEMTFLGGQPLKPHA